MENRRKRSRVNSFAVLVDKFALCDFETRFCRCFNVGETVISVYSNRAYCAGVGGEQFFATNLKSNARKFIIAKNDYMALEAVFSDDGRDWELT